MARHSLFTLDFCSHFSISDFRLPISDFGMPLPKIGNRQSTIENASLLSCRPLASLEFHHFANIANALALVGFRFSHFANVRCHLAHEDLIDAAHIYSLRTSFVVCSHSKRD